MNRKLFFKKGIQTAVYFGKPTKFEDVCGTKIRQCSKNKVIGMQWLIINYCKVNKIDNTSPCYELLDLISFTFAAFWGHQEPLWRNLASDGRVGGKEELAVI